MGEAVGARWAREQQLVAAQPVQKMKKVRRFCSKQLKYVGCREGGWHFFLVSFGQNMRIFFAPTPYVVGMSLFQTKLTRLLQLKQR